MTTNRIAARAGANVALVYRYFAGKEATVAALIERFTQATLEGFELVPKGSRSHGCSRCLRT